MRYLYKNIGDRISSSLSPDHLTWSDVQNTVRNSEAELSHWEEKQKKSFGRRMMKQTGTDRRAELELQLYVCSLRMILYRPFLNKVRIGKESTQSVQFNTSSALNAVTAAIRMMDLMPNRPDSSQVLMVLPWWTVLHYLGQVSGILLLEMCLRLQHTQEHTDGITLAVGKVFEYLWVLAPVSKSAYRAWDILRPLITQIELKYERSVFPEMPLKANTPSDWSEDDEPDLRQLLH